MDVKEFDYIFYKMEKISDELLKHSERTACLCYSVARDINLDYEYREIAYLSGLLHEIGKINLDLKLFDINKLYPYFSSAIINSFEGFENVAKVILRNAEMTNDKDYYPKDIKGEEFYILSIILRISDFYDTCRMNGLTHDETTVKLRENSDILFPRRIITPFIKSVITNKLQFEY